MPAKQSSRVAFRDVLRVRQFRMLWLAESQSNIGDQLARLALTLLVYDRTASATLTASTYALTFFPALFGGVFLSGLADRFPRRTVMIFCDLTRAVLLAVMAIPAVPLAVVIALLVVAVTIGPAFSAAQAAVLPDILDGEYYTVANALRSLSNQLAQLAGFAVGGLLLAAIGAHVGLLVDALSFAVSALLVLRALRDQPAALVPMGAERKPKAARAAASFIVQDPLLRNWAGLILLIGLFVVPEGIAAPLAHGLRGGSATIGLVMAAAPAGTALGAYLLVRLTTPHSRQALIGPFAAATGLPMLAFAVHPNTAGAVGLLFLSGIFTAYLIVALSSFGRHVPTETRGQVMGLMNSLLLVTQGLGLFLAGLLSSRAGPNATIAVAGGVGFALALALSASLARAHRGAAGGRSDRNAVDRSHASSGRHRRANQPTPELSTPGPARPVPVPRELERQ